MLKLAVRALTTSFTIVQNTTIRPALRLFTGNDFVLSFAVVDADGSPVSIAGWTTRSFGLYPDGSGTASFTKTAAFVTDGTDGLFTVTVTDSDTSALDAGTYRIEVQVSGSGIKLTPVRGVVIFQKTYA